MDELVDEIVTATGIEPAVARKAVGIIVNFVSKEGPPAMIEPLFTKLPGSRELANEYSGASGGLLGVFNDLIAAGLGMAEVQAVATAFVVYSREKAGDEEVDTVVAAIPGLAQFI